MLCARRRIDNDVLLMRDVYPLTVQVGAVVPFAAVLPSYALSSVGVGESPWHLICYHPFCSPCPTQPVGTAIKVGYQFHQRWPNPHVLYLRQRSPVAQRILRATLGMPLTHPAFTEEVIEQVGGLASFPPGFQGVTEPSRVVVLFLCWLPLPWSSMQRAVNGPASLHAQLHEGPSRAGGRMTPSQHAQVCKPNGYFAVTDPDAHTDLWAFCVLRLVARHSNAGPDPLDILFDQPLGWWDAEWPGSHGAAGCYRNDAPVNDTYFEACAAGSLSMASVQHARLLTPLILRACIGVVLLRCSGQATMHAASRDHSAAAARVRCSLLHGLLGAERSHPVRDACRSTWASPWRCTRGTRAMAGTRRCRGPPWAAP